VTHASATTKSLIGLVARGLERCRQRRTSSVPPLDNDPPNVPLVGMLDVWPTQLGMSGSVLGKPPVRGAPWSLGSHGDHRTASKDLQSIAAESIERPTWLPTADRGLAAGPVPRATDGFGSHELRGTFLQTGPEQLGKGVAPSLLPGRFVRQHTERGGQCFTTRRNLTTVERRSPFRRRSPHVSSDRHQATID
jgi:hypothetical protein